MESNSKRTETAKNAIEVLHGWGEAAAWGRPRVQVTVGVRARVRIRAMPWRGLGLGPGLPLEAGTSIEHHPGLTQDWPWP